MARPYPPTGLTTKKWAEIEPQEVKIRNLFFTQEQVGIKELIYASLGVPSYTGDPYINVVSWNGQMYLEDGHHRTVVAYIRGEKTIMARIFFHSMVS